MYLGLDLGTSGVKALLMDHGQRIMASTTSALDVSRRHKGWSEQDPAHWVRAAQQALDRLKTDHPTALAAVKGIGLSGQMHGATLLDAADRVLRPCILWNDTRSHQEAARLDADHRFRRISGNIVFPGFTAPKLVWVKENEPAIFARIAKVLLPKDYLRLWLIGDHVAEMSDAAGTSWLDTGERRWSEPLLAATELGLAHMPRLVEGTEPSGTLRQKLASRWGMCQRVVVAGGAGDNAASAIGAGTVSPGSAFVSLGTSGVLFAANESYLPNPESAVHSFCHALPHTWHQMGVVLSATAALDWFAQLTGQSSDILNKALGDKLEPPGPEIFLPYLSGERTPHNDAAIRGVFVGLSHTSSRKALTKAVMEGVAFALRDNLEALRAAGTELERMTAVGGGSRARYWLKAVATTLNLPIDLPAEGEFGAAFGAARLGMIAATDADPLTVCTSPAIAATIMPDPALMDTFETFYKNYRAIYPAISSLTPNP